MPTETPTAMMTVPGVMITWRPEAAGMRWTTSVIPHPRRMPKIPFVFQGLANAKKPAWLNDLTNYHDRGDVDFSSCSQSCYELGDVFGLDDLFTEKPVVVRGLTQIYSDWITKYKLDGFRVDTARHDGHPPARNTQSGEFEPGACVTCVKPVPSRLTV